VVPSEAAVWYYSASSIIRTSSRLYEIGNTLADAAAKMSTRRWITNWWRSGVAAVF